MLSPAEPAAGAKPTEGRCSLILQTLTVVLLAGILITLLGIVAAVAPSFHAVQPMVSNMDPETLRAVGRLTVSADRFFNSFAIEDLQLIPSSIPSLILSVLQMDIAPLASNVTQAASSMVESITGMTISEDSGDTYAGVATSLSIANAFASKLEQWVEVNTHDPEAKVDPNPWHGLPTLIFGKSPVDWLYNQTDPKKISALGKACEAFRKQLAVSGVLEFSYRPYRYNYQSGALVGGDPQAPLQDQEGKILDTLRNICIALQNAASARQPMEKGSVI